VEVLRQRFQRLLTEVLVVKETPSLNDTKVLLTALDFFCMATEAQPFFVEMVFHHSRDQNNLFDLMIDMVKGTNAAVKKIALLAQLILSVRYKLVILLSLMSQKNICSSLLEYKNFMLISELYSNLIDTDKFRQEMTSRPNRIAADNQTLIRVKNNVDVRIASAYFIKLVQNEFRKKPDNAVLIMIV